MHETKVKRFWDEAARTNPAWYVSSTQKFAEERDMDSFYASGRSIWSDLKRFTKYDPASTDSIVEIGTGLGRITKAISQDVATVYTFDVSPEMLNRAKHALGESVAIFCVTQGTDLTPVASESADAVVAYCVWQHLQSEDDLEAYFLETIRVLKPGGRLIFTMSKKDWRYYVLPLARLRAFFKELLSKDAPKGVWRKQWIGIRPSTSKVKTLCPMRLSSQTLHGDKILFWGVKETAATIRAQAASAGTL